MKKLLLLATIAAVLFACGDKPEADINYLKGNVFSGNNSGILPHKLYFVDNNTVYMYYCSAEHYYIDSITYTYDSVTYTEDSVLYLTYSIYQTIRDSVQSFYIGFSGNEQLISDTIGRGNLYLSDTKDSYGLISEGELHLYYREYFRLYYSKQ